MADKTAAKPARKPSPVKNGYLVLYNAVSAMLWMTVLGRVVGINVIRGPQFAYPVVGEFCKWTQTLAGMEVLHSLFGVVRAPLFTTVMQVFSRYAIVWGVTDLFPSLAASPVYSSMLVAWSVTEVIRYSYFALTLSGWQPAALHWLRYHAFFVLYPLGISSEAWLIWCAVGPAKYVVHPLYSTALWAYVVFVYPPSAYILYTHMMAQRRKVLKASNTKATQ
ncbi:tyrosine phosphatase-like protein [Hypoxylon argillaceum]|nr:tyrosine phosphatase-like protein [Hypoxylon argillaceum]KAI1149427.1 tyrosine phosphatase-like protein [Nemania diffusa]